MTTATGTVSATRPPSTRLVSLDVARGITIAFMILVNSGVQNYSYSALQHAPWNGWTPTDLVFPTFLFLVGVSLVFSFEARLAQGATRSSLMLHTVRRAATLFLLGIVVNGFPFFPLDTLRIYGVLQRIAVCFLLASALYLLDRRPASKIALIVIALAGYWVMMRWIPVPGFGLPVRDIPLLDPDRNLVAVVDRHIFPGRLYEGTRDPEGLLSTLPALATTLLGMLTAMWLRSTQTPTRKAIGMLVAGVTGISLGIFWGHWFPINKKLWTSSYVLFAAGCALLLLSICYWTVDVKKWRKGWTYPWLVFGMNAIGVYIFAELLSATLSAIHAGGAHVSLSGYLYLKYFAKIPSRPLSSLADALCFVAICFLPAAWLYRKKIFLKV